MKIKIYGKDRQQFIAYLHKVMNIACVASAGGILPTDKDVENPGEGGRYWMRDDEGGASRFILIPASNDYFANIYEESDTHIVVKFSYRYDRIGNMFSEALSRLILARFPDNIEVI